MNDEGLTLDTSALDSLWWPICVTNSVDNTKLPCSTLLPTQYHSFFRKFTCFVFNFYCTCFDFNFLSTNFGFQSFIFSMFILFQWLYILTVAHTALSWSNAALFDPILSAEVTLKFSLLLECKAGTTENSRVGSTDIVETPTVPVSPETVDNKQVRY